MHIVLDTNIIRQDWQLNSRAMEEFLDYSAKTWTPIVLPEVVMLEPGRLYEAELAKAFASFENAFVNLQKLISRPINHLQAPDFKAIRLEYECYLKDKLNRFYSFEIPVKTDALPEILSRWRENAKPFRAEKDAFRDAVIWLAVLDLAKRCYYEPIVFISDNVRDFANDQGNDFHPDLRQEIEGLGYEIRFFRSINQFNEVYATHMNFINEEWLVANIDWDLLNLSVLEVVRDIHCGFYFEAFNRKINNYDGNLNYWPFQASYDTSILAFTVGHGCNDEYGVSMRLGGDVLVEYLIDNEHYNFMAVKFHTEVDIHIKDKQIVSYIANYYEEESGLSIYDAREVILERFPENY